MNSTEDGVGQAHAELLAELSQLAVERDQQLDVVLLTPINGLIQEANSKLERLFRQREAALVVPACEAVQAVKNELQQFKEADPRELLLDALMAGCIKTVSTDHTHNQNLLAYLERLVLRGAGDYVKIPSLRDVYAQRLEVAGVKNVREMYKCSLRLNVGDYTAVLEGDPAVLWAPTAIPYPGALQSDAVELSVDYAYQKEGEHRRAVACVIIPFEAFGEGEARRAALAALAEGVLLPTLPHSHLKWWVRIERAGSFVEGFPGEELVAQIRTLSNH